VYFHRPLVQKQGCEWRVSTTLILPIYAGSEAAQVSAGDKTKIRIYLNLL
jgi:hypothetical protein